MSNYYPNCLVEIFRHILEPKNVLPAMVHLKYITEKESNAIRDKNGRVNQVNELLNIAGDKEIDMENIQYCLELTNQHYLVGWMMPVIRRYNLHHQLAELAESQSEDSEDMEIDEKKK